MQSSQATIEWHHVEMGMTGIWPVYQPTMKIYAFGFQKLSRGVSGMSALAKLHEFVFDTKQASSWA